MPIAVGVGEDFADDNVPVEVVVSTSAAEVLDRLMAEHAAGRSRSPPYSAAMNSLIVYAVDIGSVVRKRLGWGRVTPTTPKVDPDTKETDIVRLGACVSADIGAGLPVALGFECPLYVPVPEDPLSLGKARRREGSRPWSAGAGTGALATGLVEVAWLLRAIRAATDAFETHLAWESFASEPGGLFLWEAFVSGSGKGASTTHHGDAAIAAERFLELLPDPTVHDEIDAEQPLSLVAAAALWSGCIEDPDALRSKCLVVRARA